MTQRRTSGPGRPARISEHDAVSAALRIVAAAGIDAVTMRGVAREIGVGASALYTYVQTKEELLDKAADSVVSAVDTSAFDTESWHEGLAQWARSYRAALLRHPRMVPWFARGAQRGAQSLRNADRVFVALVDGGFAKREATLVGAATVNLVFGSAFTGFAAGFPEDPAKYPPEAAQLRRHAPRMRAQSARLDEEAFEMALGFHIAGVRKRLRDHRRDG